MKLIIETGNSNAILRAAATKIRPNEIKEYKKLAEEMIRYVKNPDNGGVGLAAPQVGVSKRLIVVSLMHDYEDESFKTIAMINPEITQLSEETCSDQEGCLSVPGESGDVVRYNWVKVRFLDIKGTPVTMKLTHLAARIVQHEIDHLNGILFTDRIEKKAPVMAL